MVKADVRSLAEIPPEPPAEILFQKSDRKVDRDGVVARYEGQGRDCASRECPSWGIRVVPRVKSSSLLRRAVFM